MNGTTNVKSIQNSILRSSVYVASATFWVILIGGFSFTLIEALLSFSYLIITPLALSLVKTVDRKGKTFISYQVAVKLGPLAAVLGSARSNRSG